MDPGFIAYHAAIPELFEDRGDRLLLRVRTRGRLPMAAFVRTEPDFEERLTPMKAVDDPVAGPGWCSYAAEVPLVRHEATTRYAFRFVFDDAQAWLDAAGLHPGESDRLGHFRHVAGYRPASWVWSQVVYQVFPERFRNGDPGNDPQDGAWEVLGRPIVRRGWDELPQRGQGEREFFGGDLQGVRQGLAHVSALGASTLYLTPVFLSPSSHKYDTSDYLRVDPHFGGEAALLALLEELRARGMRIVLDAVPNHSGDRHPWFDRLGEHQPPGAYQGPSSPFRGRYVFSDPDDPDSYAGYAGVRSLPILDYADPGVVEDVYAGDGAFLRHWLREPWRIDGWRLDVVHMLGEGPGAARNRHHLRGIRRAIREENPEAFVLGEHFFDASEWLQGDQEDGAMNYAGFLRPMVAFWCGTDFRGAPEACDAAELDRRMTRSRARLPWPIALSQLNLLSSHDVPRFLHRLGGDVGACLGAHHALMAYVGVPCVYYGDEVGLMGGEDPDNRRPFPWDPARWRQELLGPLRRLAHLRRRHPALAMGGYRTLLAEGDALAFVRELDGDAVLTVIHRRGGGLRLDSHALGLPQRWTDVLSGEVLEAAADGTLEVLLPAAGGRTFVSRPSYLRDLPDLDLGHASTPPSTLLGSRP